MKNIVGSGCLRLLRWVAFQGSIELLGHCQSSYKGYLYLVDMNSLHVLWQRPLLYEYEYEPMLGLHPEMLRWDRMVRRRRVALPRTDGGLPRDGDTCQVCTSRLCTGRSTTGSSRSVVGVGGASFRSTLTFRPAC